LTTYLLKRHGSVIVVELNNTTVSIQGKNSFPDEKAALGIMLMADCIHEMDDVITLDGTCYIKSPSWQRLHEDNLTEILNPVVQSRILEGEPFDVSQIHRVVKKTQPTAVYEDTYQALFDIFRRGKMPGYACIPKPVVIAGDEIVMEFLKLQR
jgi:hypothetical protein